MPQSNVQVSEVDLRHDLRSYYRNSICTHNGEPVLVVDFSGNGATIKAHICRINPVGTDWGEPKVVLWSSIDVNMPVLGYVFSNESWHHLSRVPARRMRKGYNGEGIRAVTAGGGEGCHVMGIDVIKQVWGGNPDRISHDAVIWNKRLWFQGDIVGNISNTGKITLTPGKEKIGEYVCKLLAANWEFHSSKHSLQALDS